MTDVVGRSGAPTGSASEARETPGARELPLGPVAAVVALASLVAAAAALGALPAALLPFAAAPAFAGGAAWPLLARATQASPSWIKLGVLGWLLAPVGMLVPWLLLRAGPFEGEAGAAPALAAVFACVALVQLAARGQRVRCERPGRSTAFALVVGVGLAALAAAFVFQGSAPRASYHGLLHSGLLLATERSLPPSNPWMAGAPLGYYWIWHAFAGLVAHAFRLAPTEALVAFNPWAIAPLPVLLQLAAATVWRDGARQTAAFLAALFGLGAVSGWYWLAQGAPRGAPEALHDALALFGELARGVPEGADGPWFDRRLSYAASKFGNSSSYPASLGLLVGAWFAATHALRHGARPWPGVTALLHGAAALVNPLVGLVGAVPTLGAAALAPGARGRVVLIAATLAALVPAAFVTRGASAAYGGETVSFAPGWGALGAALLPLALLLPAAFVALASGVPGLGWKRGEPRTAALAFLALAAFGPLALHALVELPYDNQYKLVRIAALPLGLLAGAGVVQLVSVGGATRAVGFALGLVLAVGAFANEWRGARAYLAFARVELPLVERPLEVLPAPGAPGSAGADLAAAYAWLRRAEELRTLHPVLVLDAFEDIGYGYGDPPFAFVAPHNLQGHEAPAFAAMDLWFDRPSQVLDRRTPGLADRSIAVRQLLRQREAWNTDVLAALRDAGRPVIVLVGPRDTDRLPGVGSKLLVGGFARLATVGRVELFVHPPELAGAGAPEGPTPRREE